jgi:hypothetical protein
MPAGKEISQIFDFKDGLALIRIKDVGFDDSEDPNSDIVFAENTNIYPGNWLFGFINKKGEWAVKPVLESATSFKDGISIVQKGGAVYFMNVKGELVTRLNHPGVMDYSEGFAVVNANEGNYFIDVHGKRLGSLAFGRANPFSNGMGSVEVNGAWGFIDTTRKLVIAPKYYVRSYFYGRARPGFNEGRFLGQQQLLRRGVH